MTFMGALRRSHIALNHGPWRESSRRAPTTRKASSRPLLRYTNVLKPRARRSLRRWLPGADLLRSSSFGASAKGEGRAIAKRRRNARPSQPVRAATSSFPLVPKPDGCRAKQFF